MVELGCGTGRVLLPLVDAGVPVVGVDPSDEMLRVLRGKRDGLTLVQQTAQTLELPSRDHALALMPFRAFQHLMTVDDQLEALTRIRDHLRPGGALALDVFDPDPARMAILHEPEADDVWFEVEGRRTLRRFEVRRDRATQTMEVVFRYYDEAGACLGASPIGMRWVWRYELEHLLVRCGFTPRSWSSGYADQPYDGTGDIVVVADRS